MIEKTFLFALIPYALLLVWWLKKLNFSIMSIVLLGVLTTSFVWGALYASFNFAIFPAGSDDAFASAEYVKQDNSYHWLLRYYAERFGWVLGLIFFLVFWGVSWFWRPRKSQTI